MSPTFLNCIEGVRRSTRETSTAASAIVRVAGTVFCIAGDPQVVYPAVATLSQYVPTTSENALTKAERTIYLWTRDRAEVKHLARSILESESVAYYKTYQESTVAAFHSPGTGAIFFTNVDASGATVYLRIDAEVHVIAGEASDLIRQPLRLVRELSTRRLESDGGVSLHAASIAIDNTGVLLLGRSGAGKTTLLLHLLSAIADAQFICNDRSLVVGGATSMFVHASPLPVRISAGTLNAFPELMDYARTARSERQQRSDAAGFLLRKVLLAPDGKEIKFELNPSEVGSIYGRRLSSGAPLGIILVPTFDEQIGVMSTERLDPTAVNDEIMGELRTPVDNLWPDPWIEPRVVSPSWADVIRQLCQVPAFRVRYGARDLTTYSTCLKNAVRTCLRSGRCPAPC